MSDSLRFDRERMQFVFEDILLNKIIRNHLLSENMHHLIMLPLLIISCTRSWNFAWHLLWHSTTESKKKNCPTLGNEPNHSLRVLRGQLYLNYLIVCFTQCTLFFPKFVFYCIAELFAVRYLWVVCNEDKCCVVTQRTADIRVARLVYVRTYCVPIATVNQKKQTRLLDLGEAQIKSIC